MPKPYRSKHHKNKHLSKMYIGPKGRLFFMVGQSAYLIRDWKDLSDNVNI